MLSLKCKYANEVLFKETKKNNKTKKPKVTKTNRHTPLLANTHFCTVGSHIADRLDNCFYSNFYLLHVITIKKKEDKSVS